MSTPKKWDYCRNDGTRFERKAGKKFCCENCRKDFWRNGGLPIKHFEAIVEAKFDTKLRELMIQVVYQVLEEQALIPQGLPAGSMSVPAGVSSGARKVGE